MRTSRRERAVERAVDSSYRIRTAGLLACMITLTIRFTTNQPILCPLVNHMRDLVRYNFEFFQAMDARSNIVARAFKKPDTGGVCNLREFSRSGSFVRCISLCDMPRVLCK